MNILLLGSGGREDALAWRLRQSPSCEALIAAPGNPGIARWAECVAVDPCDSAAVIALARKHSADLVVIGPEAPLVAGVGDALRQAGFEVFGPNAAAAELEGSKGFTKDLCEANGIPTARYIRTESSADAMAALDDFGLPVVIKADGLAAGKGVTVATSRDEAEEAIRTIGNSPLVIEEFLEGEESSLFALVDGDTAISFASAQDHKRVGEGDTGANTGGMGAYSPAPVLTPELEMRAMEEIVRPTARALAAAGTPFSGVLYAGLMLTAAGPKLIEYNVRFGDPECEAIMPRVEGDFAELLHAVATGHLGEAKPELSSNSTVTVIVAARGYPGEPASGGLIRELASRDRVQERSEIAVDQRHDRLAFGIAEADVILDQLGPVGGEHEPCIKHAVERCSGGRERFRSRPHDLVHRPLLELRGQHGCRRIGAHATGIRAGIPFADTLVILCGREHGRRFAIDQGEQAGFLAFEKFLDYQRAVAGRLDRGFRFGSGRRDRHSLSTGEPIGFDHHRNAEVSERSECIMHSIDADIICGRDRIGAAQVLCEPLGPLELGRCGAGPERCDASCAKSVGNTSNQRCFGPNDNEIDAPTSCQGDDAGAVARIDRDAFRPACDSRIARRRDQRIAARRLPKPPCEGILASARPQQQNIHGSP